MDFAYLRPPKRANQLCHPDSYIMEMKDGRPVRRIFHGVNFCEQQKQLIAQLTEFLRAQGFEHSYDQVKLLKFCAAGDYNLQRSLLKIRQYEDWLRNQNIQTATARSMGILQSGAIYSYGRDFYYRPIIIVRAELINFAEVTSFGMQHTLEEYLSAINTLLRPIRDFMFVPSKVENWVVLVQCKSLPAIKPSLLIDAIERLTAAYPATLEKMYLINSSPRLKELLDAIRPSIPASTYSKLVVLDPQQSLHLDRYLHAEELEQRYGGTLPNLREYWPIRSTNRIQIDQQSFRKAKSEQPSAQQPPIEFHSVVNDSAFFRQRWQEQQRKEPPNCCCSQGSCRLF